MSALNQLLSALKVEAKVFHNGQYCGMWAIDTSGTQQMTFHVVSHGSCYLRVDGQSTKLVAGDAVFFPSDARHRISNLETDDVEVNQVDSFPLQGQARPDGTGLVCGYFGHQHPQFEKLLKQLPSVIVIPKQQASASSKVVDLLLTESIGSGQSTNLLLNRLSDCLFYLILRDHLDIESGLFAAMAHPKLAPVMEMLHTNLSDKLSIDDLASAAAMSRSAFSALFKEVLQQSPIEYSNTWRMTQAYRWLADDGITTIEAALNTGYESEASFSKAFKRVMGIGPGEARRGQP